MGEGQHQNQCLPDTNLVKQVTGTNLVRWEGIIRDCYVSILLIGIILCSPTVNDMLRSLTDTYRGQGRMEDAAELERLSKEKRLDKVHKERISRIVGDENSENDTSDSTTRTTGVLSKKQVRARSFIQDF